MASVRITRTSPPQEIGFELAGHWILENDKLKCELIRHSSQKNILYAFVCDGQVKYVGKTVRPLAARMAGYKMPGKTQTTNINANQRIRGLLAEGVAVEILALPDSGLLHYGQFHLNLAAALEDDIIRAIGPEWNGRISEGAISIPRTSPAESEAEHEPGLEPVVSVRWNVLLCPAANVLSNGILQHRSVFTEILGRRWRDD